MVQRRRAKGAALFTSASAVAIACGGPEIPPADRPGPIVPNPSASVAPPRPVETASIAAPTGEVLAFAIKEGRIENRFFRQGRVAAHLLATSGDAPRLVVAFPAGNMGVGMWLDGVADLAIDGALAGVEREGGLRGVAATIRARSPKLRVKRAILGNIRVLRDFGHDIAPPASLDAKVAPGPPLVLSRTTLDGKHHLELVLEPQAGTTVTVDKSGAIEFGAGPSGDIALRIVALADDAPLTSIAPRDILTKPANDARSLEVLSFLTYEEKLLAGSWQYLTYFGRDTLLSTRLLMPVLQPRVIEAALGAVIERLDGDGDVAHEEDIGEWAVMENAKASPHPADLTKPRYDYKMVDDDFLLPAVLAAYVESDAGKVRAPAFFARKTTSGRTFAAAVRSNLDRVLRAAAPFGAKPSAEALVHINAGLPVGNWRDSTEGLGNGKIPYDVNVALVPAALRAAERLAALDAFGKDPAVVKRAGELATVWSSKAEPFFRVSIDRAEAKKRVESYAKEQGIDAKDALAAIAADAKVTFDAVSLDAKGAPVPIQCSDDGFVTMFTEPSAEWLNGAAKRILMPFPAGLRTPVGVVVANPAYATDAKLRGIFTRDHYHGTVVWSWQQALLLSGLRRQLARTDLPEPTKKLLGDAEQALRKVIDATASMRTSELWSFSVDAQGYHVVPFGQSRGHHTEANAAQLWSTVYLAL